MFDVAYEHEAVIEAAAREKVKIWDKILREDLKTSVRIFFDMVEMERMDRAYWYHSIMFLTHGV